MREEPLMGQRVSLGKLLGPNLLSRVALIWVSALFVVSCGGGGGGSSPEAAAPTPPAPVPTPVVTASVDTSLQLPGALSIPTTLAGSRTIAMGTPLPTAVSGNGFVVFGLDERGEIALAGIIENGRATFSPEGTVLALGTTLLKSLFPDQSAETLGSRLREASGFSELITNIRNIALAGGNPLQDMNVQQRFKSIIRDAVETFGPSTNQSRPLAVASRRLEPDLEPTILPISLTSKVSLWNSRAPESPSLENKVLLRNTSSLNFTAALLDPSGGQWSSAQLAGGGIIRPSTLDIPKPFTGSFTVRLMFDGRATAVDAVKAALGLFPYLNSNCVASAVVAAGSLYADARFKAQPITWLDVVLSSAWSASDCDGNKSALIKVLGVFFNVTDAIDFVRIAADYSRLPDTIDDVGVCVNSFHTRISCIKRIEVSEILPMMPSAAQSITIEYFGEDGKKTASPPYGLKVTGIDEELFTLSRTEGVAQITSNTANRVGTSTVRLLDPATDIYKDFTVKVTNGKLDKPTYSVAQASTIELRLVDPESGSEVIRGATFNIQLPGSTTTYGTFSTQGETRGPILFKASDVAMLDPLPIMVTGGDSGSTIKSRCTRYVPAVGAFPKYGRYTVEWSDDLGATWRSPSSSDYYIDGITNYLSRAGIDHMRALEVCEGPEQAALSGTYTDQFPPPNPMKLEVNVTVARGKITIVERQFSNERNPDGWICCAMLQFRHEARYITEYDVRTGAYEFSASGESRAVFQYPSGFIETDLARIRGNSGGSVPVDRE